MYIQKRIHSAYSLRRQNGRNKNSWETDRDTMIDWMKSNDVIIIIIIIMIFI